MLEARTPIMSTIDGASWSIPTSSDLPYISTMGSPDCNSQLFSILWMRSDTHFKPDIQLVISHFAGEESRAGLLAEGRLAVSQRGGSGGRHPRPPQGLR